MLSIKGKFQDGVAQPLQPVSGHDGQLVIITFLDAEEVSEVSEDNSGWNTLMQIVDRCTVDTGIADLAHQHDHYLYGKTKQE
jgi:hypothetical protein